MKTLMALAGLSILGGAFALTGGAPADAMQPATGGFSVDAVHSSVVFKVRHQGVANFYGRFNDVSGSFLIDPDKPEAGSFDITIAAESVDTNSDNRDKHLRSADFFSAKEFPTITFKSTSMTRTADAAFDVTGDLTLRGTTKPITAKVAYGGTTKGRRGEVAGIEATFTIKRSDFGVSYMVGPGLSDEVALIVSLEGERK